MNNTYYNANVFPHTYNQENINKPYKTLPMEQSYIQNIIRMNNNKKVTVHMTISNNDYDFNGIIEQSGIDYLIISEPSTGKWQLLPIAYISFITFEENINYQTDL